MASRWFSWILTTGEESIEVRWDAVRIAKEMGIDDPDTHVGIVKIRGIDDTGSEMFILADEHKHGEELAARTPNVPIENVGMIAALATSARRHKQGGFWLRTDTNLSYIAEDQPVEIVEVKESLTFHKVQAVTWKIQIEYVILEGGMRWPTEDFFKDKVKVGRQRSAGNPFYQVGDRFVIGEHSGRS